MALNQIDKIHIKEILRHSTNDIYYGDFFNLSHNSKYSIQDLLEYLVSLGEKELSKPENFSSKGFIKICYSISTILYSSEENTGISFDLIGRIKALTTAYQQFLDEHSLYQDDTIDHILGQMNKTLETFYPINSSQLIYDFASENNCLKKQLDDYETVFEKLRQENAHLQDCLDKKNEQLLDLSDSLECYKGQSATVEALQQENALLKTNLDKTTKLADDLKSACEYSQKEKLNFEIQCNSFNQEKQEKEQKELESKVIQETLIEIFYSQEVSLVELKGILEQRQIFLSEEEIYRQMQLLKNRIAIQGPNFSTFPPVYQVSKKKESGLILPISLPQGKNEIDFLLVSDFHLSFQDNSYIESLDMLYRYCLSHNIHYIFNLGDFIDGIKDQLKPPSLSNLKRIENFIEQVSNSFPKVNDVYHGFLGGNHDKICSLYGIDLFQELAKQRNDFIPLGYDYSFVRFQNSSDMIALHHPNRKFVDSFHIFDNAIEPSAYLNNFYNNLNLDRKNIYMDFLGHIHRYILNTKDSYCFVPSYLHDRFFNSALHLKFQFCKNNQIDSLVIYPLAPQQALTPTGEIVYQRKRSHF